MKKWIVLAALISQTAFGGEPPTDLSPAESCGAGIGYVELSYEGTGYPSGTLMNHKLHLSFQTDPLALDLYTDHDDNRSVRLDLESLTRSDEIYRAWPFHSHQLKPKGCIDDAGANCDVSDLRMEMEIASKSLVASEDPAMAERQRAALKCATRMINEFGKRVARELERRRSSVLIKG